MRTTRDLLIPHVTVQAGAQDVLDDGFEFVRAMSGDLRDRVTGGVSRAWWLQALMTGWLYRSSTLTPPGLHILGCRATAEEQDQRILRLFDEVIELRFERSMSGKLDDSVSKKAASIIKSAIDHWRAETEASEDERARQNIAARPGLPRPVDSWLLILVSQQLGRELSVDERIALRQRFR